MKYFFTQVGPWLVAALLFASWGHAQQSIDYSVPFESMDNTLLKTSGDVPMLNFDKQFFLDSDVGTYGGLNVLDVLFLKGGLNANAYYKLNELSGGAVDITYPVDVKITYPDAMTFGCNDQLEIQTTCSIATGFELFTTAPTLDFELGTRIKSGYSVKFGTLEQSDPAGFEDSTPSNWESLANSTEGPFLQINTNTGVQWPWDFAGIGTPITFQTLPSEFPYTLTPDVGEIAYLEGTLDNPFSGDGPDVLNGKVLSQSTTKTFIDLEFRPLNFQEYVTGIPLTLSVPLTLSDDLDYGDLGLTLFDVPLFIDVAQQQKVTFTGDVSIQFAFEQALAYDEVDPNTNVVIASGTDTTATIQAGHTLRVTYPDGPPSSTLVTPTFVMMNDELTTKIDELIDFEIGVEILKGEISLGEIETEICEPNIFPFNLDGKQDCFTISIPGVDQSFALFDELFPVPQMTIGIYDETFALADDAFDNIEGTPFSLEPDQNAPVATYDTDFTVTLEADASSANVSLDEFLIDFTDAEGSTAIQVSAPDQTLSCADIGNAIYTWVGKDGRCNEMIYEVPIDLQDTGDPMVLTQGYILELDENGEGTLLPENIDNGSTDNCGIDTYTLSRTAFDCSDVASNEPGTFSPLLFVSLTVTDLYGNSSSNLAVVSVVDKVAPVALCQNQSVYLDVNGTAVTTTQAIDSGSTDACGIASYSLDKTDFICDDLGDNTVTLTVTDINDNQSSCTATVTVVDTIAPVVSCFDQTIVFNGEETIELNIDELFDATDNCSIVNSLDINVINCAELGTIIPVVGTSRDLSGNSTSCTSFITVDGLPCGFRQSPDGIGCEAGSSATYDVPQDIFTLTSVNCLYANPYRQDEMAYVAYDLCGDVEIIARVRPVAGMGWGGIMLRETDAVDSKKFSLAYNGSNLARREARYVTGGSAYPQQFPAFGKNWFKLKRQGNQFSGYISTNGVYWQQVMAANIPMEVCIEAGLFVTNMQQISTVSMDFANVSINVTSNPALVSQPTTDLPAAAPMDATGLLLYPNPSTGTLTIDPAAYAEQEATIELVDAFGQRIRMLHQGTLAAGPLDFDLSALPAGIYQVRLYLTSSGRQVRAIDGTLVTERWVKQ